MIADPIADMLVRLQNAARAGHQLVETPFSHFKHAVAKVLEAEGYLTKATLIKGKRGRKLLSLELAKDGSGPKLHGTKRVSKLSRRVYGDSQSFRLVKRGFGRLVVSTPQGIMTGEAARKAGVGGEVLFEIW